MFAPSIQSLLLGGIIGYLAGSIPFAYIITKRHGLDVRRHGSGNVGTLNSYEVTGKKSVGTTVFALDFLKGFIPVLVFALLGWRGPLLVLLPALILGHCYPIWLRFHGGRGLATTAGAILLVNPAMLVLWCAVYMVVWWARHHIHLAAFVATFVTLLAIFLVPPSAIQMTTLPFTGLVPFPGPLVYSVAVLLLIILSRHVGPVWEMMQRPKNSPV